MKFHLYDLSICQFVSFFFSMHPNVLSKSFKNLGSYIFDALPLQNSSRYVWANVCLKEMRRGVIVKLNEDNLNSIFLSWCFMKICYDILYKKNWIKLKEEDHQKESMISKGYFQDLK